MAEEKLTIRLRSDKLRSAIIIAAACRNMSVNQFACDVLREACEGWPQAAAVLAEERGAGPKAPESPLTDGECRHLR